MLNVFKKVDGLRHSDGGSKVNGLEPPANLPDLARDMYEREQLTTTPTRTDSTSSTLSSAVSSAGDDAHKTIEQKDSARPIVEPNKDSVPRLDLSLVKQHIAASQAAIESIQPTAQQPTTQNLQSSQYMPHQPMYTSDDRPMMQRSQPSITQSSVHENMFYNMGNNSMIDDSTGFFKEFEEYVRSNGLDNDIVNDLLNKNWLDHMLYYHTIKGEETPFYASSAELSHAIKLKLEDLQNFERNWVMNKQKVDLLKKFGSTLESDIHLMSEELKKLVIESKRRSLVAKSSDLKSSGFFQLVKPRVEHASSNQDVNGIQNPAHVAPYITPSGTPSTHPNSSSFKYHLDKYVVYDSSKYFYACNGQTFKSLSDLMDGLESMDVNTFNHHVDETKNDFSNWIKGVFSDFRLADAIRSMTDRERLWYYLKNNTQ